MEACAPNLTLHYSWNTREEEVSCLYVSREQNILTGHETEMKIWCLNRESRESVLKGTMKPPIEGSVNSICQFPRDMPLLAMSVNQSILIYHYTIKNNVITSLSLKDQYCFNQEEINQIDINSKGSYLCSCDDSGEIKVVDVDNKKLLRTLTRYHDNICSSVKFNKRKPWELFSGGLDNNIGRWDFNRGKLLAKLSTVTSDPDDIFINPPMVHSLDVFHTPYCIACGLGDGHVSVYSTSSPKSMDLLCQNKVHLKSVACVCCVEGKNATSDIIINYVVSVGNDSIICIFKLVCTERNSYDLVLVDKIEDIPKVNWIDVRSDSGIIMIYTADVTGSVSVYRYKE